MPLPPSVARWNFQWQGGALPVYSPFITDVLGNVRGCHQFSIHPPTPLSGTALSGSANCVFALPDTALFLALGSHFLPLCMTQFSRTSMGCPDVSTVDLHRWWFMAWFPCTSGLVLLPVPQHLQSVCGGFFFFTSGAFRGLLLHTLSFCHINGWHPFNWDLADWAATQSRWYTFSSDICPFFLVKVFLGHCPVSLGMELGETPTVLPFWAVSCLICLA